MLRMPPGLGLVARRWLNFMLRFILLHKIKCDVSQGEGEGVGVGVLYQTIIKKNDVSKDKTDF